MECNLGKLLTHMPL